MFVASESLVKVCPAKQTYDYIAAVALHSSMSLLLTVAALLCSFSRNIPRESLVNGAFEAIRVTCGMFRLAPTAHRVVAVETEEVEFIIRDSRMTMAAHAAATAIGGGHDEWERGRMGGNAGNQDKSTTTFKVCRGEVDFIE